MNARTNAKLAALSRAQAGVVSGDQLVAVGVGADARRWLVVSKQWRRVGHRVYANLSTAQSWLQRVWIACLETGGAASHRTAGWLHRLDGIGRYAPSELEVVVELENKRTSMGVKVRRSRTLDASHLGKRAGPPCTNLARTVLDLSAVLDEKHFEYAFDSALRQQADLRDWLRRLTKPMNAKGHRGIGMLRERLEETRPPVDSALEVAVLRMVRKAKLPMPRTGADATDNGRYIAKLDFSWEDNVPPVALMAHGARFHNDTDRWNTDLAQVSALSALGWRVIQCTIRDVERDPETVVLNLRRALSGQTARVETIGVHQIIDHVLR